jgi:hypothetical protein
MSDDDRKPFGRELVLAAFLEAPDRTLTNAQLGNIPGVQAFHQRMSNLKGMGYVFTSAVRLRSGHYAYKLLGYVADSEAHAEVKATPERERLGRPALAIILAEEVNVRVVDATDALRAKRDEIPTPSGERPTIRPPKKLSDEMARLRAENSTLTERVAELEAALEAAQSSPTARRPRADRGPTGPALMRKVLEDAGAPMHSKVIAERVMAQGGDALYKGKTPAATMAAQLATSNKSGGEFVKVVAGCFGLREWDADKLNAEPIR